jgi:hypothetical protein
MGFVRRERPRPVRRAEAEGDVTKRLLLGMLNSCDETMELLGVTLRAEQKETAA